MKKILFGLLVATSFAYPVFAGGMATDMSMPVQPTAKYYKLDKKAFVNYFSGKQSSLQVLGCPKDALMQAAGIGNYGHNWTSAGYADDKTSLTYTFDFVNCSIGAYQTTYVQNTETFSKDKALATAKAFLTNLPLYNTLAPMLGSPVIVSAYSNNGMPIPYAASAAVANSGDYIDEDNATNYSIVFPYIVNGKEVYYQYGSRMGVSMEVSSQGVTSFNIQFFTLDGAMKNARHMTTTQALSYISRGGNSQYRGNKSTITLDAAKPIYVFVQDWRNNKSTNYLVTASLFNSNVLQDMNNPYSFYQMVVADYVFANQNMNQYAR